MTSMTVFQALTQLKLLASRIEAATSELNVATVVQGNQVPVGYPGVGAFVEMATSNLQSVQDLITRRSKIKTALVESNALTKIEVGGVTMTVASAIEHKNSITFKVNLLDKIKKSWYNSKAVAERNNASVQQQANTQVSAIFGEKADLTKITTEYDNLVRAFLEKNLHKVIAPQNIETVIKNLETEINSFLSEVDAKLNESNATTMIEVDD